MFVCLGNICRSPAGEAMLEHLAKSREGLEELQVSSSGIGDWHIGQLPDSRMRQAALDRGITLSSRAEQFKPTHFDEYHYILAADNEVVNDLYRQARSPADKAKVHLMTAFSFSFANQAIPDPYYGGHADFELVLDMLYDACEGLLQKIQSSP